MFYNNYNNSVQEIAYDFSSFTKNPKQYSELSLSDTHLINVGLFTLAAAFKEAGKLMKISMINCNLNGESLSYILGCYTNSTDEEAVPTEKNDEDYYMDFNSFNLDEDSYSGGKRSIETIDLQNNDIGLNGAEFIAELIEHNDTLSLIDITGNQIGEAGVLQIIAALQKKDQIITICFENENFGNDFLNQVVTEVNKKHNISFGGKWVVTAQVDHCEANNTEDLIMGISNMNIEVSEEKEPMGGKESNDLQFYMDD